MFLVYKMFYSIQFLSSVLVLTHNNTLLVLLKAGNMLACIWHLIFLLSLAIFPICYLTGSSKHIDQFQWSHQMYLCQMSKLMRRALYCGTHSGWTDQIPSASEQEQHSKCRFSWVDSHCSTEFEKCIVFLREEKKIL